MPTNRSRSAAAADPVSTRTCHIVLERIPPDDGRETSRCSDSVGESQDKDVCEDRPNADSDSGDDLFLTQKVVPKAVRSRRPRRSSRQHFILHDDTDASSSSSQDEDENAEGDKRTAKTSKGTKRRVPLPKYSFPFVTWFQGRSAGTELPARLNRGIHNHLIGGFFKCVSNSLHSLQLPTVDTDEEEISPLTEGEEEEADEDIKVVDRKCFGVLSRAKFTHVAIARRKDQHGGRSPSLPRQVPSKGSISRVLLGAERRGGGAVEDMDMWNNRLTRSSHRNTDRQIEMPKTKRRLLPEEKRIQEDTDASPSVTREPITEHDGTISDVCHADGPSPRRQSTDERGDLSPSHQHLICDANGEQSQTRSEETRTHGADQEGGTPSPCSREEGQQASTCTEVEATEVEEIPSWSPGKAESTEGRPESPSSQEDGQQGADLEQGAESPSSQEEDRQDADLEQGAESPSSHEQGQQSPPSEEAGTTEVEEIPPSGVVRAEPQSPRDNAPSQEDESAEGNAADRENAHSKPKKKKRKKSAVENGPEAGEDVRGERDVMSESGDVGSDIKKEKRKKKKKRKMGAQDAQQFSPVTPLQPESDVLGRKKRKKQKTTCVSAESVDTAASDSTTDPPDASTAHRQEQESCSNDTQDASDSSDVKRKKKKKKCRDKNDASGIPSKDEETDKTLRSNQDENVEPLPTKKKNKKKKSREEETDMLLNAPGRMGDAKTTEDEDVELLPKKKKKKKKKKKNMSEEETDSWISKVNGVPSDTAGTTGDEKPSEAEDAKPLSKKKKKKRREEETKANGALSDIAGKTGDEKDADVEPLPKKRKKKKRREEETDSWISKENNTPPKITGDEDVEVLPKKRKKKKNTSEEETDSWISNANEMPSDTAGKTGDEKTSEAEDVKLLSNKKKKRRKEETKVKDALPDIAGKTGDEKTSGDEDAQLATKKKKKEKRRAITADSRPQSDKSASVVEKKSIPSFPVADTEENGAGRPLAQTQRGSNQRVREKKRKESAEKRRREAFEEPSVTRQPGPHETAEATRAKRRDGRKAETPAKGPGQTDEAAVSKKKKKRKLLPTSMEMWSEMEWIDMAR